MSHQLCSPPTDYIQAKLSVRMTNGPDFVATDFEFYNCNRYQQCSECVSAPFPCDWCVDGHRCTHDTAENCRNDILVTGLKVGARSDWVGVGGREGRFPSGEVL